MAKKKKTKLLRYLLITAIVLIIFAIVGKKMGWIGRPDIPDVELSEVKENQIIETVSASGKIQPEVEIKISPDVSGEITDLFIAEGDSVQKGQLLLRIRPDNYELAVQRAKAALNTSKANLAQAKARAAQAKARLIQAEINFKRNQELHDQKVLSDAEFDQSKADHMVAKEEYESAHQSSIASAFNLESAKVTLNESIDNLSRTAIYSPVNGTISQLNIEKGERVVGTMQMAGTEMLRIANLEQMEVLVDVNENDIIKVELGDTAIIEVDSYAADGIKFKGIVTEIANSANASTSIDAVTEFQVKVRIINDSHKAHFANKEKDFQPFRPGMSAAVEIITQKKDKALSVPLAAVTTRKPKNSKDKKSTPNTKEDDQQEMDEVIFVYNNGKVQQKKVKTGISDFNHIEILEGVKKGEKVVSGPYLLVSKKLKDGDQVGTKKQEKQKKDKTAESK